MKLPCFQKIWLWFQHNRPLKNSRNGAMTLVSVFLFIVFSTLGLGMIYMSQVYLKMSAFKKNSIVLDYASENGVKQGFDQLVQLLSFKSSPSIKPEPLSRDLFSSFPPSILILAPLPPSWRSPSLISVPAKKFPPGSTRSDSPVLMNAVLITLIV